MTRKRFLWKPNLLWNWYIHRRRKKQKTTTKMRAKNRSISSVLVAAAVTITVFMCRLSQTHTHLPDTYCRQCVFQVAVFGCGIVSHSKPSDFRFVPPHRITTPLDRIPIVCFFRCHRRHTAASFKQNFSELISFTFGVVLFGRRGGGGCYWCYLRFFCPITIYCGFALYFSYVI